jgi:hypothetical protein
MKTNVRKIYSIEKYFLKPRKYIPNPTVRSHDSTYPRSIFNKKSGLITESALYKKVNI